MFNSKSLIISEFFILNCIKNKVFVSILLLALVFEITSIMFSGMMARDIGRGITDFVFSVVWLSTFIFTIFYGINEITIDKNKDALQLIFSRPVSKANYVVGMFLGFVISIFMITSVVGFFGLASISYIESNVMDFYFGNFSNHIYALALLENAIYCIGILSFIFLASGFITSYFPLLLLTISYCFICNGIPVVIEMIQESGTGNLFIVLLQFSQLIFPDYSTLNLTSLISDKVSDFNLIVEFKKLFYFFAYIVFVITLTIMVYNRKELN